MVIRATIGNTTVTLRKGKERGLMLNHETLMYNGDKEKKLTHKSGKKEV